MAILSIGNTINKTIAITSRAINKMVRWGAINGVSFDSKKTKVIHFSYSKLRTALVVYYGDIKKYPKLALYWLGIWLNSRLSF